MAGTPIVERPPKTKTPRRFARHRVNALMYLDLGSENGGFPINISEDGIAFQGIRPLEKDQEICIALKLDGIGETITATAKVAWLTESRKAGALQFVNLPDASRRLIADWIALQSQVDRAEQKTPRTSSRVKGKELPTPSVPPLAPQDPASPVPAAAVIATPPPSSPQPVRETVPAIAASVASKPKPEATKSLPPQHPQASAASQRSPRIPTQVAKKEEKSGRSSSYWFGLTAAVAVTIVFGAMLQPLPANLFPRFHTNKPQRADVDSAPALAAARPPQPTPIMDSPGGAAIEESSPLLPIAREQEDQGMPYPVKVTLSPLSPPAENSTPLATPMHHAAPSKVPGFFAGVLRPRRPAIAATKNQQPATIQPGSISEETNDLPIAGTAAAKITLFDAKPPAIPVSATGSIEIISDLYPSIRMPADPRGRPSRQGTSLQIGRLISKIDPAYPQEALRQRIMGTVRVHIVVGRDGTILKAEVVSGPALLADATLRAVQQWRYEATMLGGKVIEVEENVTAVFRIANSSVPTK